MKIRMTLTFSDSFRRALNTHYGVDGKASRSGLEHWVNATLDAAAEGIGYEHDQEEVANGTG